MLNESRSKILIPLLVAVSVMQSGPSAFAQATVRPRTNDRAADRPAEKAASSLAEKSVAPSNLVADEDADKQRQQRAEKRASEKGTDGRTQISELVDKLDYPELMVVPRASDRLRIEAREEANNWWYKHWQLELSGAATFYTAISVSSQLRSGLSVGDKNTAESALLIGNAVGIGWIAAGVLIGFRRPYRAGVSELSRYEGKDARSQVTRERLAEESLEAPARLMRPIQYFAMATNLTANLVMGSFATDQGRLIAGVGAILSFMPLIYQDESIRVYDKHLEYKSRIYGPLTSVAPMYDRTSQKFVPSVGLAWAF